MCAFEFVVCVRVRVCGVCALCEETVNLGVVLPAPLMPVDRPACVRAHDGGRSNQSRANELHEDPVQAITAFAKLGIDGLKRPTQDPC